MTPSQFLIACAVLCLWLAILAAWLLSWPLMVVAILLLAFGLLVRIVASWKR